MTVRLQRSASASGCRLWFEEMLKLRHWTWQSEVCFLLRSRLMSRTRCNLLFIAAEVSASGENGSHDQELLWGRSLIQCRLTSFTSVTFVYTSTSWCILQLRSFHTSDIYNIYNIYRYHDVRCSDVHLMSVFCFLLLKAHYGNMTSCSDTFLKLYIHITVTISILRYLLKNMIFDLWRCFKEISKCRCDIMKKLWWMWGKMMWSVL